MNIDPVPSPVDPLLERLERLSQRRPTSPSPQPGRTRRRHPAKAARIGALVMSCASTVGLTSLLAQANSSAANTAALASLPAPIATASAAAPRTSIAATVSTAGATSTAVTTTAPATAVTVATPAAASTIPVGFDGAVVNTRYGPVQVQAQVANGGLVEVAVIQYPDGDGKSVRINSRALPTLRTEALSAGSADVHTVSGATYTSNGYTQSLQSALDAARAAGALVSA